MQAIGLKGIEKAEELRDSWYIEPRAEGGNSAKGKTVLNGT